MKTSFKVFVLALVATSTGIATAGGEVNQSKIDDIKNGKLTEARASWWGFDPVDSTKCLQSAIHSGAKRVIIEDMGKPWIVTPLKAASNQELVFEKGVVLQAKKGEYRGRNDSLLSIINCENVTIKGYGATFRMHRDDYAKAPYEKAEWRNTLQIRSSSNIQVSGLTMAESGGDGIYLGVATRGVTNRDVHIRDVILEKHYRQGISVISAENLLIENTIMRSTAGTAPMAGIDFEPNHPDEVLVNCVMRNCVSENNQGVAYAFYLPQMNAQTKPISIRLENCVGRGSNRSALYFTNGEGKGKGPLTGTVEFVNCDFSGNSSPVVTLRSKPDQGTKLNFVNCRFKSNQADKKTPVIRFMSRAGDREDVGNVHFENCVVEKSQDQPVMEFHDGAGGLRIIHVTGTMKIQNDKSTTQLELTTEWLNKLHRGNTFKRFPKYETTDKKFVPLHPTEKEHPFKLRPFSLRRSGTYALFARRGTEVEFKLKSMQVGNYSGHPVSVKAVTPGGKQLKVGKVPFQSEASLSFTAPETGLYRIPIENGANRFQLLSTNCPTVISGESSRVWLIRSVGDLYFYVPAGTKEFGIKIYGEGMEGVGAEILNPQGKSVWKHPTITTPEQFVGTLKSEQGEIWTLRLSRPTTGAMEDYYIELQGIPPFLATNRDCLLKPVP